MNTETNTTATTTSTRNRRAPKRQLGHADSAIAIATNVPADDYAARLAATTAEVKPTVQLTDEQRARIEKEKAKLEKEERAAARRKARLEALERGEELPTATKGLPPVVKMNELGALARQLHRAHLLALTDDARRLMGEGGASEMELSTTAYALRAGRDKAIACWNEQHRQRAVAGAADNDTLAPLGLALAADGEWVLVEKKPAKETATE